MQGVVEAGECVHGFDTKVAVAVIQSGNPLEIRLLSDQSQDGEKGGLGVVDLTTGQLVEIEWTVVG